MPDEFQYPGMELDLFARAENWKRYWGSQISPYLGERVLDVGAGKGATADILLGPKQTSWVALEPDASLMNHVVEARACGRLPASVRPMPGTVADLDADERFDTALYMDVLEHIEDDRAELLRVAEKVESGGHVIVLAPAHQSLFTPFDRAIGHFRRYNLKSLLALAPPSLDPVRAIYLDSAGLLASIGNKLLLRSAMPTPGQIALWDKVMISVSRWLDPVLGYRLGKSVLVIWRKR